MHMAAVGIMFFRSPQGNFFLAKIDMMAPVPNTPSYSRTSRCIGTQNTKSVHPREHPCQNSAGQVPSNPLLRSFGAIRMKRERLRGFESFIFITTLGSLFLSRLRSGTCRRPRVLLPFRGSELDTPAVGIRFPPEMSWFLSFFFLGPPRLLHLPSPWPLPLPLDFLLPSSQLPLPL